MGEQFNQKNSNEKLKLINSIFFFYSSSAEQMNLEILKELCKEEYNSAIIFTGKRSDIRPRWAITAGNGPALRR